MSGGVDGKNPFGPFELRPGERALTKAGRNVRLGARAFDILLALPLADDRIPPAAAARLLFHAGSIWRAVDRARALALSE